MSRIAGIELPSSKAIWISLTRIKGVGRSSANKVLIRLGIDPNTKVKDLSNDDLKRIRTRLENDCKIEGDLSLMISQNIRRLKEINSYRGDRHKKNLPVHGQRTKTNARTKRGRKMTVSTGRRAVSEKT
jgi:small subunit ribosomal protein S13